MKKNYNTPKKNFNDAAILTTKEYVNTLKSSVAYQNKFKKSDYYSEKGFDDFNVVELQSTKDSFLKQVLDRFSVKFHLEKKISFLDGIKNEAVSSIKDDANILASKNINDPIIDLNYIKNTNFQEIFPQFEFSSEQNQLLLEDFCNHLTKFYLALNSDKVDIEFIKSSFLEMYSSSDENIFNGLLRGQKLRHEIIIFEQAFNKNPAKFKDLDDLIPVNLGTSVPVIGISDPRIICHSIGGTVTCDSLKYAHEILISRAASAKFNLKLFVKLDQNDAEVKSVLDLFEKLGRTSQVNSDVALLDEDNMTFIEWDIKNEYLKFTVSRKFDQKIIQLGNYLDEFFKEKFEDKYIFDLLRDFQKKIKDTPITVEERAILIKRHNELVSYLFSKDSILLVPSGDKKLFSPIKLFLDIHSYVNKK